ncbi:MAG: 4-alpha-glucanotransferase [Candidatus Binataceae bacterium]
MDSRCAGILVPLFSLNRRGDLGRGDIIGLAAMGEMALAMGHRLLQMLPNDEIAPNETSPYSAVSVFAIDPLYIAVDGLPLSTSEIDKTRAELGLDRHLVTARAIERERLYPAQTRLLETAYRRFCEGDAGERAEFKRFHEANRYWLDDYALFRALKARFEWRQWEFWPADLRDHKASALVAIRLELTEKISQYQYWQFIARRQWLQVRAGLVRRGVMLGGDLAFSPGRESAEVWANQSLFDLTRAVGAPPDAFSVYGQRWGLPMPKWAAMRAGGFKLIRARVRRARELFDVLRIDHAVGLYRTYSFALDAGLEEQGCFDPAGQAEQIKQGEEVVRAIQQEAGAMSLIAEDLGLIPPFVRKSLTALGVPGYKVMRWEKEYWDKPNERFIDPLKYPELSLATTGTHDTASLQLWWRELEPLQRKRLLEVVKRGGAPPAGPRLAHATREAILEALYAAPSRLAITPLQDLFGWDARINTPGTIGPLNWNWRIPCALERMMASVSVRARLERLRALVERTGRW